MVTSVDDLAARVDAQGYVPFGDATLSALIAPDQLVEAAKAFFNLAKWSYDDLRLQGHVTRRPSGLEIDLTARLDLKASIGIISLTGGYVGIRIRSGSVDANVAGTTTTEVVSVAPYIGASVEIGGKPIDVAAALTPSGRMYFEVAGAGHGIADLAELTALLGSDGEWCALLPKELPLADLSLERVLIVTDLSTKPDLVGVEVDVRIGTPGTPVYTVPDTTYVIADVLGTWRWLPRAGGYSITVTAKTQPAKGYELDLSFGSDFVVTGTFVSDTPLTLAAITKPLVGADVAWPDTMGEIGLSELVVSVDVRQKGIAIVADIQNAAPICQWQLSSARVELKYDIASRTPGFLLLAQLRVSDAVLSVSAGYATHLAFALDMQSGTLRVSDLAAHILPAWAELPPMPDWAAALTLKDLHVAVTPATNDFQFHGQLSDGHTPIDVTLLELPEGRAVVRVTPAPLDFSYGKDAAIRASAAISVVEFPSRPYHVLPAFLRDALTKGVSATLSFSKQHGVVVSVDHLAAAPLEIPARVDVKAPEGNTLRTLDLGTAALTATKLSVTVAASPSLSVDIGFALPSRLNDIFGSGCDVFQVYDTSAKTGFATYRATVSSEGITVTLAEGCPLTAMDVHDGMCSVSLGRDSEYGRFTIAVPTLKYTAGSFEVTDRYQLDPAKPLAIPLRPLQEFLTLAGLPDVARALPCKVPVPLELSLIEKTGGDRDGWTLKVDAILAHLRGMLPDGTDLHEVERALRAISTQVGRLPDRLCEYLDVRIPDGMQFSLATSTDGGVRFSVRTSDTSDLKMLFPVLAPLPALQGVTLKEVSFGEVLGGSLFLLTLTADFDRFDLLSLADSLAMQQVHLLPVAKDFHSGVIVKDLYCFVVYETGVPIPVPAFYGEVGLDYLGVQGVSLQAHAHFPLPSPGLSDLTSAAGELYRFVTDKTARLDEAHPPKLLPTFTLNDCYIKLPGYLGGKQLGQAGEIVHADLNAAFARAMNGLKFLTLADLIAAIPIEYRVNKASAGVEVTGLGGISMNARWIVSTSEEFAGSAAAYKQLEISDQSAALALVALAPGTAAAGGGLIVVLLGGWNAFGASLDTAFVLVARDTRNFATGLRVHGAVAGLIDIRFQGHVQTGDANGASGPKVETDAHFELFGRSIFDGQVSIDSQSLSFKGSVALFADGFPLSLVGGAQGRVDRNALEFTGGLTGGIGFLAVTSAAALRLSADGMAIRGSTGSFGNIDLTLRKTKQGTGVAGMTALHYGPLAGSLDVTAEPGKDVGLTFKADVGPFGVRATFRGAEAKTFSTKGTCDFLLAGYRMSSDTAAWTGDDFVLQGVLNFGPLRVALKGGLGKGGLSLHGSDVIRLPLPDPIGTIEWGVRVDISSTLVGVGLTLPAGVSGRGAIALFHDVPSMLIHATFPLHVLQAYIVLPLAGAPAVSLSAPSGWPRDL